MWSQLCLPAVLETSDAETATTSQAGLDMLQLKKKVSHVMKISTHTQETIIQQRQTLHPISPPLAVTFAKRKVPRCLQSQETGLMFVCSPMDYRAPGSSERHSLLEFPQVHVHRAGDAIQPCHCGAAGAGRRPGPGFRFPLKWWDSPPPSGNLEPANQYAPSKKQRES